MFLFQDETTLRMFPPLRAKWAPRGTQPVVHITGRNDRRVLYGSINPRTGHRTLMRGRSMRQGEFQAYLRLLHRQYKGRKIWLILDEASCHKTPTTLKIAHECGIGTLPLPKQTPELNPMDHLWRPAKGHIAANRQYATMDQESAEFEKYILHLPPREALRLAGILSQNFWLRQIV